MKEQDRLNFAVAHLDRVLGFIPRAEGKVTAIVPIAIAMLGVVALKVPIREPCSWRFAWAALAAVGLVLSLARSYETLFPRLRAPQASLIYFGEISKLTEAAYVAGLRAADVGTLTDDAASQIWRNSEIAGIKFAKARAAFNWLALSLLPWFVFLALVTLKDGKFPMPGGG